MVGLSRNLVGHRERQREAGRTAGVACLQLSTPTPAEKQKKC